jgi:hypothetical protein
MDSLMRTMTLWASDNPVSSMAFSASDNSFAVAWLIAASVRLLMNF